MFKLLYFVPKNLISYIIGFLVDVKWPEPFNQSLKVWFVKRYHIDMKEAEKTIEEYTTLAKLFSRKLKPGLRPVGEGFVHPCDGKLTMGSRIENGQLIQAKGKYFNLKSLLAGQEYWSEFEGGHFLTYYLCPTDYHRVHFPEAGKIISCTHVPGVLWPVNKWSVNHISDLFSVNERTLTYMETDKGKLVLIMVGATNVGKITMSFDKNIVTNQSHFRKLQTHNYNPKITVKKGDEVGVFNMGSTVVLLTTPGFFENKPSHYEISTRMGESLF
jgi:phosphatidylserine decarboxylase